MSGFKRGRYTGWWKNVSLRLENGELSYKRYATSRRHVYRMSAISSVKQIGMRYAACAKSGVVWEWRIEFSRAAKQKNGLGHLSFFCEQHEVCAIM